MNTLRMRARNLICDMFRAPLEGVTSGICAKRRSRAAPPRVQNPRLEKDKSLKGLKIKHGRHAWRPYKKHIEQRY
jgi:hypothetical protein